MVRRVTWDAQDAHGVDVFLRSGTSLEKRTVKVNVTNFGASPHEVTLAAICLAMQLRA